MNRRYFKCPTDCGTFIQRKDIKKIVKKHRISASFSYNQSVQLFDTMHKGKIKYIGMTSFGSGYWYGIRLDSSLESKPKNKFIHYFKSKESNIYFDGNHKNSLFVRPNQLRCIKDIDIKSKPDNIIKPIRSHPTNSENALCQKQRHERRNSEPLTPSSMDSKPLTPSKQILKTRTVSMGFNIRKEYLLKTGQFPEVAVNKKNRSIQFKKREYTKHGTSQVNTRKFRVRKPDGSSISITESNSDGLLFRGCDVPNHSKKKKSKNKIVKKVKVKNVRSKRAQSDGLNKRKKVTKKTRISAVKSNKRKSSKQSAKSKRKKKIIN